MPTFQLEIVNEHFQQSGELQAADVSGAWTKALESGISIAADQVSHGNPFFGAEITLTKGDERVGRYVLSVGATPLKD